MEKKLETLGLYRGIYWGYFGIVKKMETTIIYEGNIGITEMSICFQWPVYAPSCRKFVDEWQQTSMELK